MVIDDATAAAAAPDDMHSSHSSFTFTSLFNLFHLHLCLSCLCEVSWVSGDLVSGQKWRTRKRENKKLEREKKRRKKQHELSVKSGPYELWFWYRVKWCKMWRRFGFSSNSFCVSFFSFSPSLPHARIPQFLSSVAASLTCICILILLMPISRRLFLFFFLFLSMLVSRSVFADLSRSSICAFLGEGRKSNCDTACPCLVLCIALHCNCTWCERRAAYAIHPDYPVSSLLF